MPINRLNRGKSVNRITGTLDIAQNSIDISNATDGYNSPDPRTGRRYTYKRIITSRTISVTGTTMGLQIQQRFHIIQIILATTEKLVKQHLMVV